MFVWRMERPSQKNVLPMRLQFAKSDEERVWKASVLPIAMRSCLPMSGTTEMFEEKLK
jgi:hypothetical protein